MKIRIGFFSVMLFFSLLLSHSYFAIAALLAIFIHELGHIAISHILKIKFSECTIGIFGASLTPVHLRYSYHDEIFLSMGGPLFNLLSVIAVIPFTVALKSEFLLYFTLSSVTLALFNIMPIRDLDGGRIVHSLLCIYANERTADALISISSFATIFILWLISVYFLLVGGSNFSLFIF